MARDLIAAFAAPTFAIVAIGVGAALASGLGSEPRMAYGEPTSTLSEHEARLHAETVFDRADLDRSGALDADEYAALAIVTAELARLNGYLAIETGGDEARTVALPISAPSAMSPAERARIDAFARADFYAAAGADMVVDKTEFAGETAARFAESDRDGDGALGRRELTGFAAGTANITASDA